MFFERADLLRCRGGCLRGQPALFAATADARANTSALAAFAGAYPSEELADTGETRLWNGPFFAPAAGTLDGWLLDHWFAGAAQYDALFVQNFSSASEVKPTSGSQGFEGHPRCSAAGVRHCRCPVFYCVLDGSCLLESLCQIFFSPEMCMIAMSAPACSMLSLLSGVAKF